MLFGMGVFHEMAVRLKAAASALRGKQGPKGTPVQRARIAGHLPGWPLTSKLEEGKHNTGWVYVATHAIAKQLMQATVSVYDESQTRPVQKNFAPDAPSNSRKPLPNHSIAKLLKRPNPMKSGAEFRYQLGQQICLPGVAVVWEVRNQLQFPMELWVLPKGWLYFQTPSEEYPLGRWRVTPGYGGMSGYMQSPFGSSFDIDCRETIQIGFPDALFPGDFVSPLSACSQLIDIAERTDIATLAGMLNSVNPSGFFSIVDAANNPSQPLTDEQVVQLRAALDPMFRGAENVGNYGIGNNIAWQATKQGPSELDYVNGRNQNQENILMIQGVPSVAAGKTGGTTYSGNAAALNAFAELTIQPMLDLVAGAFTHRWQKHYGEDFCVEMSAKRTDDPTLEMQRADKLLAGVDKQCCTPNEWRAAMKLPPIQGGDEMKQPEPDPAMAGMGPDGQPADQAAVADDFDLDLEPDMGDDETTGQRNPLMQRASGAFNRMPSRNGSY